MNNWKDKMKAIFDKHRDTDKNIEKPIKKVLDKPAQHVYTVYKEVKGISKKPIAFGLSVRDANILLATLKSKIDFDNQHSEAEITYYKKEQDHEASCRNTDEPSQESPKPRFDEWV